MTRPDGYLLDNRQAEAGERFGAFAALFDPTTFRHLEGLGVGSGWRCWEVGAGGPPSCPGCRRRSVRPARSSRPTSTRRGRTPRPARRSRSASTTWAPRNRRGGLRPRARPARSGPCAGPGAGAAVDGQGTAPGGRLLIEDADPALQPLLCPDEHGPEQQLANRLRHGFRKLLAGRGADLSYGRKLPGCCVRPDCAEWRPTPTSPSPHPPAPPWSPRRSARSATSSSPRASPPTRRSTVTWRTSPPGSMDLATAPMISAWGRKE